MPVDPEVLVGALPNGLRFYVRPNGRPARQAELRLVVKAGSVLEDDDQRGLAHFVEHMQFEGTRHFPGQGINEFLGSLGLSIGADANAATSFDETQYTLRVPTDVPGALDTRADDPRRLGGRRDVRPGRASSASAPSSSPSGGCTWAPTSARRTRSVASSSQGRATRTASPIGTPEIDRARHARAADAVLPRLVSARPDGGDRRRRRRSQRSRADDRAAFHATHEPVAGTAAARVRRAGTSRHPLRGRRPTRKRRRPPSSSPPCGRRATRARSAAIARS